MTCPKCNASAEKLSLWYEPDGGLAGLACWACDTGWYSSKAREDARLVIDLAVRGLIATTQFPDDAVEAGKARDFPFDPRDDQGDFDDFFGRVTGEYVYYWAIPGPGGESDGAGEEETGRTTEEKDP